jgi:hypothetical protein
MNLTEEQRRRLVRILGMMGSHHDGEILNAARAAQRLLGSLGLTTWEEVLLQNNGAARWSDDDLAASINAAYKKGYAAAQADAKTEAIKEFADTDSCPAFARMCLANYKHLLSDWEIGFCESWSVKSRYDEPTNKQIAIFQRLARKVNLTLPQGC